MKPKRSRNGRNEEKRVDLVLEGGGVKGVGLVGALAALEEHGYRPQNIAGTSVGAIVGALLAAGYTAAEIRDIMMNQLDFRRFKDLDLEGHVPFVGKPLNLLLNLGIYEGKAFERQMAEWLEAKGVRTFKQLLSEGEDANKAIYRYKLQVIASDLATRELLVLPRDAYKLGLNPDRLSVARAVRMSMSVPIYFKPVRIVGPERVQHVIVDGGLLSNFPVWLFDSGSEPAWPTFGLHLVNAFQVTGLTNVIPPLNQAFGNPAVLFASFLASLALTALEARDEQYIEEKQFARTIPIPTLDVGLLDFDIPLAKKKALYRAGYTACQKFLDRWDFQGYIAEYRSNKEHSRTQKIAATLKAGDRPAAQRTVKRRLPSRQAAK